ncbi:MAG: PTS sugar transporter subunit IIB [Leptotrichia wadei]
MIEVLAVCGSGMGTSMIMKLKVGKVLQKLGIQADVNSCSLGEAKSGLSNYDLVLASTHIASELKGGPNTKIIGLLNLLDEKELESKLTEAGIA